MIEEGTVNKYVIIIGILCSFAVAFTSNALSVALPTIALEFNLSNILQNWVVNIYLLIIACLSVPIAKVSAKYGLKRTLIIGLIIYIIGALLSGFSINTEMLFVSRFIHGIGSAI
jgi:MFS family permease